MRLYHFTAGMNLRGIAKYGLTVGDVPTDLVRNTGRIGVWFTSSQSPDGHGLGGSVRDKSEFRLTVDVPDESGLLVKWSDWSIQNCTPLTRNNLIQSRGDAFETWFVFFGNIPPENISVVSRIGSDDAVEDWKEIWPQDDSRPGIPPWRKQAWQKRMLKGCQKFAAKHGTTIGNLY